MKKYRVYEDNGGGLYLAWYDDNGKIETLHGGYEYRDPGDIATDIQAIEAEPDENLRWDNNELSGNPDGDYTAFEDKYPPIGLQIVADNEGIYPERMGQAAKIQYGID